MIKEQNMTPFRGVGDIKLLSKLEDVRAYLTSGKISYQMEVWPNKGCTPEVPWTILRVEGCLSLFFAKGLLWKIEAERGYEGSLPNGIRIGMKMTEAEEIDKTLEFDDWNEDWSSKLGYWLVDSVETKEVEVLCIFIKELLDEDQFDTYAWADSAKHAISVNQ